MTATIIRARESGVQFPTGAIDFPFHFNFQTGLSKTNADVVTRISVVTSEAMETFIRKTTVVTSVTNMALKVCRYLFT
jgi:hypothetical protein